MKVSKIKLSMIGVVLILTGLFFSGCRHFEGKPLDEIGNLSRLEQRSLVDPGLRSFVEMNLQKTFPEWPPDQCDFQILTLSALYFSPELGLARAKSLEADAAKTTAAERPNPSIGISPGYNASTPSGASPWILGITFDLPIETAGKKGYRVSEAGYLSDAAKLKIAGTAWEARANLKRAMISLWSAKEQELLVKQKIETIDEVVRISTAQFKAGDIDKNELMRVQMTAEQARLEYGELTGKAEVALVNLAAAAGLAPHALDKANIDLSGFEKAPQKIPSAEARRTALLNRADILSALAAYAASESALQIEIAKQYPDFSLSPGYEYDQGDNKWQIGFQLSIPLFSNNSGPIAEADAKRNTAAAEFNALQSRVLSDIETAAVAYQTEQGKLTSAESLYESSQRQAELINKQYKAGEISKQLEVLSRLETLTAALARLDSKVKTQEALGELELALQTPLDATILPASNIMEVK